MLLRIVSGIAVTGIAVASNASVIGVATDTCPAPTAAVAPKPEGTIPISVKPNPKGTIPASLKPKASGTFPSPALTISGSNVRSSGQGPVALGPKPDDPSGATALGPKPDDPSACKR